MAVMMGQQEQLEKELETSHWAKTALAKSLPQTYTWKTTSRETQAWPLEGLTTEVRASGTGLQHRLLPQLPLPLPTVAAAGPEWTMTLMRWR
jgi:hypothetical protein